MTRRQSDPIITARRRVKSAIMRQSTKDYAVAVAELKRLVTDSLRAQFGKNYKEITK